VGELLTAIAPDGGAAETINSAVKPVVREMVRTLFVTEAVPGPRWHL
jgi:hypothetical protein